MYIPAAHGEHASAPPVAPYWPTAQSTQRAAALLEYFPSEQSAQEVLPETSLENLPDEQEVHVVAPVFGWYFPGAQFVQDVAPSDIPNLPGEQLVHAMAFVARNLPDGHTSTLSTTQITAI